jgi:hypothetical protein
MSSWQHWAIFLSFLAIAGYLLTSEHRVHFLSALPYLIFLACPLMMMFMHHEGHDSGSSTNR